MSVDQRDAQNEWVERLRRVWREQIEDETSYKLASVGRLQPLLEMVVDGTNGWDEFFRTEQDFQSNQLNWRVVEGLKR